MYPYLNQQKALLIDASSRQDVVSCFSYDSDTEVFQSCSLTWHNGFYVFGGASHWQQISQIIGTKLRRIGSLNFVHYAGTCDVMAGEKIFICFNGLGKNDYKRCRMALSPLGTFNQIQQSTYAHRFIEVAASDCKRKIVKHDF